MTWDRFLSEDVAPLLGGLDAANRFLDVSTTIDRNLVLDAGILRQYQAIALEGASHADESISRRWLWLADRIARRRYNDATA